MKRVTVTELDERLILKVEHQVKGMVSGVSVFLVADGQVQEILPGVLSKEEEQKVISRQYDRVATKQELDLTQEVLRKRDEYVLGRVVRNIETIGGTRLIRLLEVGGRYFAYTMHENLLYTRIAEVLLTPDEVPVDFHEVPLDFIPLVAENISNVLMQEQKKGVTIQFGEGLFLRLKRLGKVVSATILRLDGERGQGKLKAPLAFILEKQKDKWVHQMDDQRVDSEQLQREMQKALNHVLNELVLAAPEQ